MTATLNPDPGTLPVVPNDGSEPVFANPWQAQIFSLVVGLHQGGCFSWREWTENLSAEIAADQNADADHSGEEANPSDSYYRLWVRALERILTNKTILSPDDVQRRVAQWRKAYLNTPHGKPVALPSSREQVSTLG